MPRVNVKDKRKQQLIEANIASIAKRGLADTTIEHVSKGAGMSRGIVNFYFTSKEKMMQETLSFMAADVTSAWQQALASEQEKGSDSVAQAEAVLRAMMSDRLCSQKRLAVWAAFMGHAGTHAAFAKVIRAMDDTLESQLVKLWQEAGYDVKSARMNATQLQALVRGHWLVSALDENTYRPSAYIDAWMDLLRGGAAPSVASDDKVVTLKPKKQAHPEAQEDEVEFTDALSLG